MPRPWVSRGVCSTGAAHTHAATSPPPSPPSFNTHCTNYWTSCSGNTNTHTHTHPPTLETHTQQRASHPHTHTHTHTHTLAQCQLTIRAEGKSTGPSLLPSGLDWLW